MKITRGFGANIIGAVLPVALILFTVPVYLKLIGVSNYGIMSLVWIVFGYLGVFDFGISRAVNNAISRSYDEADCHEIIWSASAISFAIGLATSFVAGLFFFAAQKLGKFEALSAVSPALPLMVVGIPVLTLTATLNGALEGKQRFVRTNAIQIIGVCLYQLGPIIAASIYGPNLPILIAVVILARVAILAMYVVFIKKEFGIGFWPKISRSKISDLLQFGASIAVVNIMEPILTRLDQFLIAKFAGPAQVAVYNIAMSSIGRMNIIPLALSKTLFPQLAKSSGSELEIQLARARPQLMLVWFAVCAVAVAASDFVFAIWLRGGGISSEVSAIAKLLIVGIWANCLAYIPYTALQATGRASSIVRAHMWELPFYIPVLMIATWRFGVSGAALAWGVRTAADYVILWRMLGLPLRKHGLFLLLAGLLVVLAHGVSYRFAPTWPN